MINKLFINICLILFLFGCAPYAKGPLFSQIPNLQANKCVLFVYRKDTIYQNTPMVKINEKLFVKLGKKGYSYAYMAPGIYKLTFDYGFLEAPFIIELPIEEQKEIYLRLYDIGFHKSVTEVEKEKALEELKEYRFEEQINLEF